MTNTYKTTKRPRQKYASITFRVTEEEREQIRKNAHDAGCRTESEYLRLLCQLNETVHLSQTRLLEKTPSPSPSPESTCSLTDLSLMRRSPQSKHGQTPCRQWAELRNKFLNHGAKEAEPPHAPKASRGYGRLITDSKRMQPSPLLKPGRIPLRRSVELLNKFQNPGAKARRAACPIGSRGGYGRLSMDSKRMQPSTLLKPGRTPLRRSAELRSKIGDILSHPLIRQALYYLLMLCLVIEEYLIRLLIEE